MRVLFITIVFTLSAILGVYYLFAERVDDGFFLSFGDRVYDPVGEIQERSNKLLRNCKDVTKVPLTSPEAIAISGHLRDRQLGEPSLKSVIKSKEWLIAESEFTNSEPAIFVLQVAEQGYIARSEWGGTAAPFVDGPVIREHFIKNAPDAPKSLISCYE